MSKRAIAFAAALALVPAAALAHHGWSSYDAEKIIKVTGKLTDVAWRQPHGEAKIAYQGKTWVVILAPTSRMESRGLTQAMVGPQNEVTLEGYPRKDGTPEMRIERVMAGGKTVELR